MARTNKPRTKTPPTRFTHEGAPAAEIGKDLELRRSVLSCMLWEDTFYESGEDIADRIMRLSQEVDPLKVDSLALYSRHRMHLRHVPLWLCVGLARRGELRNETLYAVIQRADEMGEFLSMYWGDGDRQTSKDKPLPNQVKKGLATSFTKFDAYQLAKYDRATAVRLRDILFMTHAKPKDEEQAAVWKQLVDGTLPAPDTWEVGLSRGDDKKETWERLLLENKLGAMALIRNLRNMLKVDVPLDVIREALKTTKAAQILPFRFISAAQAAPKLEPELDELMLRCLRELPKLPGETIVVVDVSGSMYGGTVSGKSKLDRAYVACALAAQAREMCEEADIYATAGNDIKQKHDTAPVPARRGMALIDAIHGMCNPLGGGGIFLKQASDWIWEHRKKKPADRIIVITDEQDTDHDPNRSPLHARQLATNQYLINVASYENGIGYGPWVHIDGFSEATLQYIVEFEKIKTQ